MRPHSTILVVDDDVKNLRYLQHLLAAEKYQVVVAERGADALICAVDHRPDAVILDVMMPEMDGYEVCRRLRADPRLQHVPILLLTALDDRESKLHGLEAGADDFLSKPVDSMELRIRLRTITRLNRFRQLCDERARFETAVDFAPDAVVLTDDVGRIVLTNQAFRRLLAADALDDHRHTIFDFLGHDEARPLRAEVQRLREIGRRVGPLQVELLHARTPDTRVEFTVGRLPGQNDAVLAFNIRDITDRLQMEAQLLRSQRIELLGQLAGGIVHDVNNVLTAISGNAMLIDGAKPEEVPGYIENVQKSVRRGAGMLRQILMFARGSDQELVPTSTAALVHEISNIVQQVLGRGIAVSVDAAEGLPWIEADATQLHQILMNFCVNARDAMPEGGQLKLATHRMTLTAEEARRIATDGHAGDFVTLSVRDTGTGMPPDVRARLFDPFFTTKPADRGTGLGLATVLRLTRRHQGFIGVETAVGQGTCFTCYFPVPA